jgi:hypothetical protein
MSDILTMLATLAALRDQQAALLDAQDAAIPAPLRRELRRIAKRFAPDLEQVARDLAHTETHVKEAVLAHGASVQGARLQAVYVQGKAHWDDRALQGFASFHPGMLVFRTVGATSVSLRPVRGKTDEL